MSERRCRDVLRWLDEEDSRAVPAWVTGHARDCTSCAATLARVRSLEAWLADATAAAAPRGFTDAVLARLDDRTSPAAARAVVPLWVDPMPVWVRLAMEPAVMLALALAGLCLWQGERLRALAVASAPLLGGAFVRVPLPAPAWALSLGLLPVMLVATVALFGWSERLVSSGARRLLGHP